jgi:hypothetical protein
MNTTQNPLNDLFALSRYLNRLGLPARRVGGWIVIRQQDLDNLNHLNKWLLNVLSQAPDLRLPDAAAYIRVTQGDNSLAPLPNCSGLRAQPMPMARKRGHRYSTKAHPLQEMPR